MELIKQNVQFLKQKDGTIRVWAFHYKTARTINKLLGTYPKDYRWALGDEAQFKVLPNQIGKIWQALFKGSFDDRWAA